MAIDNWGVVATRHKLQLSYMHSGKTAFVNTYFYILKVGGEFNIREHYGEFIDVGRTISLVGRIKS
jgi:hypothetical protein